MQDFGEYQESYYSVQTTEGEQISQLIAGYIDIILKKASHSLMLMQKIFYLIIIQTIVYHVTCLFLYVLILQKQSKDRFGLDGDEEATMLEESVSPKKSVHMFRLPMMLCF